MPDSFTIVQWKEEYYRTVRMERKIAWTDDYFVDVMRVKGADPSLSIDWMMHFSGELSETPKGHPVTVFSEKKPYKHLHSMQQMEADVTADQVVAMTYMDGDVTTRVLGAAWGQTVFYGRGPDNPSVSDINYQIERCFGGEAVFAHVVASGRGTCTVQSAAFERADGVLKVTVTKTDGSERIILFEEGQL